MDREGRFRKTERVWACLKIEASILNKALSRNCQRQRSMNYNTSRFSRLVMKLLASKKKGENLRWWCEAPVSGWRPVMVVWRETAMFHRERRSEGFFSSQKEDGGATIVRLWNRKGWDGAATILPHCSLDWSEPLGLGRRFI